LEWLLGAVVVVLAGIATWVIATERTAGRNSERVEQLEKELERARKVLRVLGGRLPSVRDSLDIMSDAEGGSDRPVPNDESDGAGST
jgi:Flp pilus assembly protein TadB